MINPEEALAIIRNHITPVGTMTVSLNQALGRVVAEDVIASAESPPFDNAAMDGYAVRHDDLTEIPRTLRIAGEIPAGSVAPSPLRAGEAMSIMTGALIPEGCTAVVQQEWTESAGDGFVTVLHAAKRGLNIRPKGSDIPLGARVVEAGTVLTAPELGLLASLGLEFASVRRPPEVAILTTGSEILGFGKPLPEGKIYDSNAYVLGSLARECGCDVQMLGNAKDDPSELGLKMKIGLATDMLITSGGVSVGKYDLVTKLFEQTGVDVLFSRVNIKPGMPLVFGKRGQTIVFGLPGNPVSSMVTFLKFVRPALWAMMGRVFREFTLRARLVEPFTKSDGKRHYVRGVLHHENGYLAVRTTGSQVSNVLSSLSKANCLIIIPEDVREIRPGDDVEVELLPWR